MFYWIEMWNAFCHIFLCRRLISVNGLYKDFARVQEELIWSERLCNHIDVKKPGKLPSPVPTEWVFSLRLRFYLYGISHLCFLETRWEGRSIPLIFTTYSCKNYIYAYRITSSTSKAHFTKVCSWYHRGCVTMERALIRKNEDLRPKASIHGMLTLADVKVLLGTNLITKPTHSWVGK